MSFLSSSLRLLTKNASLQGKSRLPCTRQISTSKIAFQAAKLPDINKKDLVISKTTAPKVQLPNNQLVFGQTFTDHMLSVEWTQAKGWGPPRIHPYEKIALDPSAIVFHYGLECFEGMKAYKDAKGKLRLFRPDMNMKRLLSSAERLAFPAFDREAVLECIKELLKVDERWIPSERGYSLYIRPTIIATQESLGVGSSNRVLLFVICSPVGPYYKSGFAAVALRATHEFTRAWPGGTGDCKLGANYAPGILPQIQAAKTGYAQNLWLFGPDHHITEAGTMNFFVFMKNEKGEKELITPPLDGTILPGVTRDSMLALTREWNEFKVTERPITIAELLKAQKEGRLLECFGAGTAAIVSPVKLINYKGVDYPIPLDPKDSSSQAGPLTKRLAETIMSIQYGEKPSPWSVVIE